LALHAARLRAMAKATNTAAGGVPAKTAQPGPVRRLALLLQFPPGGRKKGAAPRPPGQTGNGANKNAACPGRLAPPARGGGAACPGRQRRLTRAPL
jgi:hypothetical protein